MFLTEILSAIGLCFRLHSSTEQLQMGLSHIKRRMTKEFYLEKNKAVLLHGGICRAERELEVSSSVGRTCAGAGSDLGLAAGLSVFQVSLLKLLLS